MAFKLLNPDIEFPSLYPKVERKLDTVQEEGFDRVGNFTLRNKVDYMPQIGLQESVCACECNLIFMCGQGTSGKTFSMYLKALSGIDKRDFKARIISVRALDSQKGSSIFADGVKVCGGFGGCEYGSSGIPTFAWPQYNSNLQLIHSNFNYANPEEKKLFEDYAKKQQASLIMIDEATEMNHFGMFAFWFMRNRDDSGMIPQMILSFNPLHEHWTTEMLRDGGYLDDLGHYLRKDMMGKVRYFYNKGDNPSEIIWGDTREEVVEKATPNLSEEDAAAGLSVYDLVKSFTVFTGTGADNRKLVHATGGQSVANLHAVGGSQRKAVGEAYFGPIDNESVNISRSIIHQMWTNPIGDDCNVYATFDVSAGKSSSDNSPMVIWRGLQIIEIILYKNNESIVDFIERNLSKYNIGIVNFAYDATGVGGLLEQFLKRGAIGITANRRTMQEFDQYGNQVQVDEYFNLRSQLLGKTETLMKSGDISISLPKDTLLQYGKKNQTRKVVDILFDEMNIFTTLKRNKKIYYRSKDEYKSKFKSSPDLMDAISYRAVFELDTRARKQPKPVVEDDAYDELYQMPPRYTTRRF